VKTKIETLVNRATPRVGSAVCSNWFWGCLMLTVTVLTAGGALQRSGVLSLPTSEAGDVAGDALQVSKALIEGWFITGHHTDVGVSHPGPFGLWVKASAHWLHDRGVGETPFAATTAALSIWRVAILVAAGWLFGASLRSRTAGVLFTLTTAVTFASFFRSVPNTPMLHFFSPYPLLLLLCAALAWSRGVTWAGVWFALAAGMVSHLHTPSMPLGVLGLVVVGACAIKSHRTTQWRTAGAVGVLFAVPLVARVVLEPGFPFNYAAASSGRIAQRKASPEPYARFQFLGEQLSTDGSTVFVALVAASMLLVAAAIRRSWRVTALTLLVPVGYAVAVIATSYPHQRFASELLWVPGLWVFLLAGAVATVPGLVSRAIHPLLDVAAAAACLPAAIAAIVLLLGTPLLVWFDDGFVRPAADAVEAVEQVNMAPLALAVDSRSWVPAGAAVTLELQRRKVPFCLISADGADDFTKVLLTFVPHAAMCAAGDTAQVMRLSDSGRGEVFTYDPAPQMHGLLTTPVRISVEQCVDQWLTADGMLRCSLAG
jgi:hypothetical protein